MFMKKIIAASLMTMFAFAINAFGFAYENIQREAKDEHNKTFDLKQDRNPASNTKWNKEEQSNENYEQLNKARTERNMYNDRNTKHER